MIYRLWIEEREGGQLAIGGCRRTKAREFTRVAAECETSSLTLVHRIKRRFLALASLLGEAPLQRFTQTLQSPR
jgi:hypothetical protein